MLVVKYSEGRGFFLAVKGTEKTITTAHREAAVALGLSTRLEAYWGSQAEAQAVCDQINAYRKRRFPQAYYE